MMDHNIFESRLAAVEAILLAQPHQVDYSPRLKALEAKLDQVASDAQTALARRIPNTAGMATKAELQAAIKTMAIGIAQQVASGEKNLSQTLNAKIGQTVGEVYSDVQSAKNAAYASGTYAAGMLLIKSSKFGS